LKRLPLHRHPWFAKRVLEVGGGHDPYVGVTHAVDMLPEDDSQRAGALRVGEKVVFREGVLEDIPFKNEPKFDYLYLSHVLEHTPSPEKAAKEINRVASRGYIETPSPLREQITCPIPFAGPEDFHLHFIWKSQVHPNTIAFVRKNERTIGEFTPSAEGKLAKKLFQLARGRPAVDVEPLLPRSTKTTYLFFRGEMRVVEYASFADGYARGDDAYAGARDVGRAIRWPWVLRSGRFRKLRALLV
jgi:SAM-dependent methyltransferase